MRIRKNTKLSSILPSHASTPETLRSHVCQLNQSPWDVVPLSQDSCLSLNYQFEGEDSFTGNGSFSFTGNGSFGDSMCAVESVASMMDGEDKTAMFKVDEMIRDDNGIEMEIVNDYKNEPKNRYTLCDHHLSDKGMAAASASSRRGGRARAAAKKSTSSSSNPYEFYYYSGFGPSWGRRRGERVTVEKKCEVKEADNSSQNGKTPSSSSQINNDEFDFVDDEDDQNGDTIGSKRIRKPVKARSLKSLM